MVRIWSRAPEGENNAQSIVRFLVNVFRVLFLVVVIGYSAALVQGQFRNESQVLPTFPASIQGVKLADIPEQVTYLLGRPISERTDENDVIWTHRLNSGDYVFVSFVAREGKPILVSVLCMHFQNQYIPFRYEDFSTEEKAIERFGPAKTSFSEDASSKFLEYPEHDARLRYERGALTGFCLDARVPPK